jgi:hypothetical protein
MIHMTQDSEARRSAPRRKDQGAPPGVGLTIAIAAISGIVSWLWLASGSASPSAPTAPNASDLTEVEKGELGGALMTVNLPNDLVDQFREGKDGRCRRPLAWVSLVSEPGEPPSRIRVISGNYYSPIFQVTATPVRIAIPFPAPYETGQGVLTAMDVGGGATISLLPSWRVAARDGKSTHAVTWHPVNNCPRNG